MKLLTLFQSINATDETKKLEQLSLVVFVTLSLIILLASISLAVLIERDMIITPCVLAGVIGSATAALLSALQRRASGWELEDGKKVPEKSEGTIDGRDERFSLRMAPYFLFRPILGIIGGLIVYYGSDFLITPQEDTEGIDFKTLIFFSLLAGLFAKTLIEILKGIFKAIFGRG